jgi:hypothetical protein
MRSHFYPFLENIEDPFIVSALLSLSVDFNSSFLAKLGIHVHGSPVDLLKGSEILSRDPSTKFI